jgi:hypothetical protein
MKLFSTFASKLRHAALALAAAAAVISGSLLATAPLPADAAVSIATATRNARCTAIVTAAGSAAQLRIYSGARPANANTAASGTLLATITMAATIGTCTSGALDFDEAGATQTAASHVSGTPGYARLQTSGGTAVYDIDVCGAAPCWTFTGTVATGQNVTLTTLAFTEGNV